MIVPAAGRSYPADFGPASEPRTQRL